MLDSSALFAPSAVIVPLMFARRFLEALVVAAPLTQASLVGGYSFATYSEDLPSVGFDGDSYSTDPAKTQYQRKHNPVANGQAGDAPANNHVPFSCNHPFPASPTSAAGYAALPAVSFVV